MSASDVVMAEALFVDKGKDLIFAGIEKLFWPALRKVGVRSLGGALN